MSDLVISLRWLRPSLLCAWGLSLPVLGLLYVMLPVSPDNALFDYGAWLSIGGLHYYTDVVEQNWPGMPFIHGLGIQIFGAHFWTFRLIDFIFLQLGCLGIFLFLRRCGFSFAPYIILLLYPPLYITLVFVSGERDIVATHFLFVASGFMLADVRRPLISKLQLLGAGSIIAFAVMIRPTYLVYFPLALIIYWSLSNSAGRSLRETLISSILLIVGFVALVSFVLLWSIYSQNLDDWYEQAIIFNLEDYYKPTPLLEMAHDIVPKIFKWWHWPTLFAAIGFTLWIARRGFLSEVLFVVGICFTILLSFFIQRKGVFYHIAGLMTVFAVLAAVMFDELQRRLQTALAPSRSAWKYSLMFALAVAVIGTASKLKMYIPMLKQISTGQILPVETATDSQSKPELSTAEVMSVSKYIREHSKSNDYILQWGLAFHVGFLAQRRSSTRFINYLALDLVSYNKSRFSPWLDEFSINLKQRRPKFVVVASRLVTSQGNRIQSIAVPTKAFESVLGLLSNGYTKIYEGDSLILMQAD